MKHALRVVTLASALAALGCVSSASPELSPSEIAEVLQIKAWRIPEPATGSEWSLEIVTEQPTTTGRLLERGTALVSLRPTEDDQYEFTLKQRGAQGSGTMAFCREPEGTASICESYSLEFESTPKCIGSCLRAVLAHVASTSSPGDQRWLLLVSEPTLTIRPSDETKVVPIP